MFANCQLPPEPDVALHAVLARLMAKTSALKADPSDGSPVADLHEPVHNYERLFNDTNSRTSPTPAVAPRPLGAHDYGPATAQQHSCRHCIPPPLPPPRAPPTPATQ